MNNYHNYILLFLNKSFKYFCVLNKLFIKAYQILIIKINYKKVNQKCFYFKVETRFKVLLNY